MSKACTTIRSEIAGCRPAVCGVLAGYICARSRLCRWFIICNIVCDVRHAGLNQNVESSKGCDRSEGQSWRHEAGKRKKANEHK